MRLPSYLQKNIYGVYYLRVCFPKYVRLHLRKIEYKKTLSTKDKRVAIACSRIFKNEFDLLCRYWIPQMNWLETKELLNRLIETIIERYRNDIMEYGTYGDHITNYPELLVEKEADEYLNLIAKDSEVSFDSFPTLKEYTEKIINEIPLDNDVQKFQRNATQVAEMLIKLKNRRFNVMASLSDSAPFLLDPTKRQIEDIPEVETYESQKQQEESSKSVNQTSGVTLNDLVEKFIYHKVSKNQWSSPDTITLNTQKLNYLVEFFDCIKGKPLNDLAEFTSVDAEQFEKKFPLLPKNRTKKYPDLSVKDLISMSEKGQILVSERIAPATYNSYVDLLSAMFQFATEPKQSWVDKNQFVGLKIKTRNRFKREPYGDKD